MTSDLTSALEVSHSHIMRNTNRCILYFTLPVEQPPILCASVVHTVIIPSLCLSVCLSVCYSVDYQQNCLT